MNSAPQQKFQKVFINLISFHTAFNERHDQSFISIDVVRQPNPTPIRKRGRPKKVIPNQMSQPSGLPQPIIEEVKIEQENRIVLMSSVGKNQAIQT